MKRHSRRRFLSTTTAGAVTAFPDNMNVSFEYADGRVLIYEDRLFTPYGMHGVDSGNAFYGMLTKAYREPYSLPKSV